MLKEIRWSYLDSEEAQSALTEDEKLLRKKGFGWDMVGFTDLETREITWLPLGANIKRIAIYHAETGRLITEVYVNYCRI